MTSSTKNEQIAQLRYRARTDLYWLATEILGNKDFVERVHRPVCEFFVKKRPGLTVADHSKFEPNKERLLLDPRGHFKTTIDEADIVQWILVDPNVRILLMSGNTEIAELMIANVKKHFQKNPKMRRLFPEYCPPEEMEWGNLSKFVTPARTKHALKEPTVIISSQKSVKASWHFDIIKGDDLVNEINSEDAIQIKKSIRQWNFATPLLEPYGFRDLVGTRYDESDLYGWAIENKPNLLIFKREVWALKREFLYLKGTNFKINEKMVDLLFPERFTFDWLNEQRTLDPYIFNCQYLNDPTPTDTATFTEDLLTRHTIPGLHIPKSGTIIQVWDIGFSDKTYSDFSVGINGLYDSKGNLFITDMVLGKFSPSDLVNQIFTFALKYRPSRVAIEEAGGSKLMLPALEMMMRQYRRHFNLEWVATSPLKHKTERIAALQPLIKGDRVYFSAAIRPDYMKELVKQFIKFPKYSHDDIPDAVSMLLNYRSFVDIQPDDEDTVDDSHITSVAFDSTEDNLMGAGIVG
jgi:predicted phage terminase large subunit-like protein